MLLVSEGAGPLHPQGTPQCIPPILQTAQRAGMGIQRSHMPWYIRGRAWPVNATKQLRHLCCGKWCSHAPAVAMFSCALLSPPLWTGGQWLGGTQKMLPSCMALNFELLALQNDLIWAAKLSSDMGRATWAARSWGGWSLENQLQRVVVAEGICELQRLEDGFAQWWRVGNTLHPS
mmetsp:Transcript_58762/g.96514  ORF Transcript_58762/g.96514 Transcript_58762/m.96514 type:complete len:176 (+) Transcript_58762:118-645(+)